MRFIPDAVMSSSSKFSNLRGQDEKYHAGNFSRKWKDQHNLRTGEERQHPIYQAFEAAGEDYPIPPHMTPEYSYSILEHLVEQVNEKTQKTGKQTQIVVDKTFERYMQRDENGIYYLAPIEEMSVSESEVKPRTLRSRIKSYIRPAIAVATSLAIAVGSWIYVKDYDQNKEARMQQQRVREFYSRYYPGLLMEDGKLPSNRGMGLIDMLADESAAFVHGDIDNAIYGNNTHLTKLAEEGRAELAPSL